jgi:hypothetical protein
VWLEQALAALGADDRDELTKDVDGKIQIVPSNLERCERRYWLIAALQRKVDLLTSRFASAS